MSATRQPDDVATRTMVERWYQALDQHVPFEQLEPFIDDEVRFVFPEGTVNGKSGLRDWYETVTHRFFDEQHRVDQVQVEPAEDGVEVRVMVNWTTRVWDAPAPSSQVLSYDADQTWQVVADEAGRPVLRDYVVNGLAPVGDTPPLT